MAAKGKGMKRIPNTFMAIDTVAVGLQGEGRPGIQMDGEQSLKEALTYLSVMLGSLLKASHWLVKCKAECAVDPIRWGS